MHTSRSAASVAVAALLLLAAGDAAAQPAAHPTIAPGQSVDARLESGDPALTRFGRFRVYRFQAQPGRRYVARMDSPDFDAYLTLARSVGGITDPIAENDDGGEGTNARLRFSVREAGTYLLIAKSLRSDGTGAFTLSLDTIHVRPPVVREIALGQTVTGQLTDADPEYDDDDGVYHLYRFRGGAGQRVRARVWSEETMTVAEIGRMEGNIFVPLEGASSDFGGIAVATLPAAGTYHVRAGAWGDGGSYTLELGERAATARVQPIRRGEPVRGTLGAGDADLDDGRLYHAYTFRGRAGERVVITHRSEDFDAYLFLGRMSGGEFEELDRNDDSMEEEGLNSRIDFVLPADGEYVIHATTFSPGAAGDYVLTLQD
jgi:hypothetical protein